MMSVYFQFTNSGNVVVYGGGMGKLTPGDKNNQGNKEVYDLSDWSIGGDKIDFLDWAFNDGSFHWPSAKPFKPIKTDSVRSRNGKYWHYRDQNKNLIR